SRSIAARKFLDLPWRTRSFDLLLHFLPTNGLSSPSQMTFQGSPLSDPDYSAKPHVEGLPAPMDLNASLWKRISLSLAAFALLATWFDCVFLWQVDLTARAKDMHARLENCRQQCKALCTSLASILEQKEPTYPPKPEVSKVFTKKIAGYAVCLHYVSWLKQTERDLAILISETAV
uniref:Uncharacterized protein n=1 Tax=Leptobrachium leishanense TaxID=445787 RepID=A0A8C5QV00_9ANUR